MVRNILIGLVVLVVGVVGVAFVLPQQVHVERSIVIGAAPDQVFNVINDLTRSKEWGPWYKRDPKMQLSFEGPPAGVGAKLKWSSATEGDGSQEIVESTAFSSLKTKLDFGDDGTAEAIMTLATTEGGTKVTWGMDTDVGMNPVGRYMGLMFDTWVGKDYEEGLTNLKQLVEAQAQSATNAALASPGTATPPDIPMSAVADASKGPEISTVEARAIILTRASAKAADAAAISAALGAAYQKLLNYGMSNNINVAGAPLAITISHSAEGDWVFDAAMPLDAKPDATVAAADGVKMGETYAGRVVKLTHKGPYNTMGPTYERIHAYTKANNLKEKPISWEEYVSDPAETDELELLTNVYVAIE
ncbi:MAG: SRPBCC family protein [Alphaproteobacteria bacterium]|nr:SRPBCC family protein [Alphaproteobacteria bacterium]